MECWYCIEHGALRHPSNILCIKGPVIIYDQGEGDWIQMTFYGKYFCGPFHVRWKIFTTSCQNFLSCTLMASQCGYDCFKVSLVFSALILCIGFMNESNIKCLVPLERSRSQHKESAVHSSFFYGCTSRALDLCGLIFQSILSVQFLFIAIYSQNANYFCWNGAGMAP